MLEITISDIGPVFDGVFVVDLAQQLNGRELHLIKKTAGVRFGELDEALGAGDYDVILAFATIALVRAGKVEKGNALQAFEILNEAETGKIIANFTADEEEVEDSPPAPSETMNGNGESSKSSSVVSLSTGEDLQVTSPPSTGVPRSATGAA